MGPNPPRDDRYAPPARKPSRPAKLSYALVTDDESRAIFRKIVRQHAIAFKAYCAYRRLQGDTRDSGSLFQAWWITKATLRFATSNDAVHFKADLRQTLADLEGHN